MAFVEQRWLVKLVWLPRARRVAPAKPENRERLPADQRIWARRQPRIGEERGVALGGCRRVEQRRTLAERWERHPEATKLRRARDPPVATGRGPVAPRHQR